MKSISLLQLAIRDVCIDFRSVTTLEEAESVITLEELQCNILSQLDLKLNHKEKEAITLNLLRSELLKNNLFSTQIINEDELIEVWLVKSKR
jgi:hypothetical protein